MLVSDDALSLKMILQIRDFIFNLDLTLEPPRELLNLPTPSIV